MTIYPKTFFETSSVEFKPRTCFVIMPFGDPFDELYHEIIKEALEENNFSVIRADELYGSKPIMEDILEGIESAEIIVADLSGRNPNVFYELGIAHSRKINDNVIIVTQDIEDVPFDLRPYRIISYKPSISGAKALRTQLINTIKELTLKPFTWRGHQWQPMVASWHSTDNGDILRADILQRGQVPLIVNRTPINRKTTSISFTTFSSGPEVNLMFYFDGKNRFSGYHFWFWQGGVKLRRLDNEVELVTNHKLKKDTHHSVTLKYESGEISAVIDKVQVLTFTDGNPLHENKRLNFMGFNIAGVGHVNFYDLDVT